MKQWPKVGSRVTYRGVTLHWFQNMIKDAEELLEKGKEYTLVKVHPFSSWCAVELEEIPGKTFSLNFFEYPKELSLHEIREANLEINKESSLIREKYQNDEADPD